MAFPPLGIGLDVDMETGEPVEVERLARDAKREEARAKLLERHQRLHADLAGNGGEVCRVVAERLADRINQLIAGDPVASELLTLLSQVGSTLTYGERIAQHHLDPLGVPSLDKR